ncbi:BZ3500_MvSof-1268-A1-R1_Chr5-2g08008 [Microbotryum saponariae]|uniref:BZ3500_MvSof-1268-A1-R1_Chr5-2g08008 protein n=1 Tax=Microbotryum saponariae TaxID=289078 RepID=A0A2X0NK86_9BASI|nr:BZ3500_MvSof-1268-A1-R1_Chr5-2g08008 [Microbotryum saponariae]SDA05877.1 BZ3501_MvSof-1269-A2-R1_Chr5-2g07830 [Microbotryum saponariae]
MPSLSQPRKIADVLVGPLGYGAMNMTWKPEAQHTPDEQAFETLKTAIDAVPKEAKAFINCEHFCFQIAHRAATLTSARFFKKFPDYSDRVFLSVKAGMTLEMKPDSSLEALRENCKNINKHLGGRKMDLFEPARVDTTRPIEEVSTMESLKTLQKEGHFAYIGLSETAPATLRRAAKVGPVAAVEVEYSPWSTQDIEGPDGIIESCRELGIAMIAYSPLGRGFITGTIKSRADLPEGDSRLHLDRFSEENFEGNLKLVEKLDKIAKEKECTVTQLALAWNLSQADFIVPIPGSTRPEGVKEGLGALQVDLNSQDLDAIREVVDSVTIVGGRYNKHIDAHSMK